MTAQEAVARLLDGADLLHVGGAAYLEHIPSCVNRF